MEIKTKYEIGQHIWVVYASKSEVCVYDDYIGNIVIDEGGLAYSTKEAYEELKEENIILYDETNKLVNKIKEIMQEIREKENKKKER